MPSSSEEASLADPDEFHEMDEAPIRDAATQVHEAAAGTGPRHVPSDEAAAPAPAADAAADVASDAGAAPTAAPPVSASDAAGVGDLDGAGDVRPAHAAEEAPAPCLEPSASADAVMDRVATGAAAEGASDVVPPDDAAAAAWDDAPQEALEEDEFGDFAEEASSDAWGAAAPAAAPAAAAGAPEGAASPAAFVDVHAPRAALRATMAALLPDYLDASVPSSAASNTTQEPLREIEGLAQVLASAPSRALYHELQAPVPIPSTPLDWTRSATRRQHLLALGVPLNLDEVHQPRGAPATLPPLELHVDVPAPNVPIPAPGASSPREALTPPPAASAERYGARRRRELGGTPPVVDLARIDALVHLSSDQLTLQTLPELRALVREMQTLSQQASDLLAHHLMIREAFYADAEMYHAKIRDVVAGASHQVATSRKSDKRGLLSRASSLRRARPGTPS